MRFMHQSAALQTLAGTPRQLRLESVLQLRARCAGWLQVEQGAAWITRDGDAVDHVLAAGDGLWLGHGERVLAEPWRLGQAVGLRWAAGAGTADWPQGLPVLRRPLAEAPRPPLAATRRLLALTRPSAGAAWQLLARGLRGAAGRLAAAARSAEAMASRAQGSICAGDSIASSGALQ